MSETVASPEVNEGFLELDGKKVLFSDLNEKQANLVVHHQEAEAELHEITRRAVRLNALIPHLKELIVSALREPESEVVETSDKASE